MKYYYEQKVDTRSGLKYIGPGTDNYKFAGHFHHKIELFCIRNGSYDVTVNGKSYHIKSGDTLLCYSYDVHSFDTPSDDLDALCLQLPTEYASEFFNKHQDQRPASPVISNMELVYQIFSLTDKYIVGDKQTQEIKKNATALIFSLLEKHITFTTIGNKGESSFIRDLLQYIENNISKDLSLNTISQDLGYSVAHISRTFNKFLRSNITDYVNRLRYKKVQMALSNSKEKITHAIFEAGFKSVQTYYRIKAKIESED